MRYSQIIGISLFILLFPLMIAAQQEDIFIHVDQFGYHTDAEKVAVISNPQVGYNAASSYTPGPTLEVRTAASATVVFSGTPQAWNGGGVHDQSGDAGWWFDFSDFDTPGGYYIYDPTTEATSAVFEIWDEVYVGVMKAAGRMFYYNRCNAVKDAQHAGIWWDELCFSHPLQDENCRFIEDPGNASLERSMPGGWFDAGDYNKYVTFAHSAVHNLLSAYEEHPEAFSDNWDLPESGNGIPDVLDELKWELDWLLTMVNDDGSVHIKVGSQSHDENALSPPSANTDQRFYGPTCSSASMAAASMLAHAAKVYGGIASFAGYAAQLQEVSMLCLNYSVPFVENNTYEMNCDDGSIVAGDSDEDADTQLANFVTAAVYLFELTGESWIHESLLANAGALEQLSTNFWGPYFMPSNDALLLYAQLPGADAQLSADIQASFTQDVANNFNGYYGFNEDDLYRAYMPDWSYHWGSNQPKAGYGILNHLAAQTVAAGNEVDYERYIDEVIHYFHGVNPLGLVYLSNMDYYGAEYSVNELYHLWFADGTDYDNAQTSEFGCAPGYVTGGPNPWFSVTDLSPPYGQPAQKSYLDFNTGWPQNSWEVSEPAIYYQAAYIRLLANRVVDTSIPSYTEEHLAHAFTVFPNPASTQLQISGDTDLRSILIYTVEGQLVEWVKNPIAPVLDVSHLPNGVYFIQLNGTFTTRWVKMDCK
ncbi:MAG: glycoside hydrolase family 9 protein [Flavobacteriales bacterium]|nr:glycoside hydrolase family 9 protein [Flavobacteriales bacterium]